MQKKAVKHWTLDEARQPKSGTGTTTGRNRELRITQIIHAAQQTFQEDGYARFTTRRVASRVGITLGNLQYYYRTKEELLRVTLQAYLNQTLDTYREIANRKDASAARRCSVLVERIIQDINETDLPKFMFQIWAFSQHDSFAAALVDDTYAECRCIFSKLLAEIHPALTSEECLVRASILVSQITGMMIFAYHGGDSDKDYAEFIRVTKRAVKLIVGLSTKTPGNDTLFHCLADPSVGADDSASARIAPIDPEDRFQQRLFELTIRATGQNEVYYRPTVQGKRREVKINEIVSSAANLLATEGYGNFTQARVARELGILPSALQNYFPTYDDLLHSTIDALMKLYLDRYTEMGNPDGKSALDRLRKLVKDVSEEGRDPRVCRFSFEMFALAQHSERTRELVGKVYSTYRAIYAGLVREIDSSATARECLARATLIAAQLEGTSTLMFGKQQLPANTDSVFKLMQTMAIRIAQGGITTET
ncbi:TetR/AcrR family transcriptional regulator [Paraburkholderia sp. BL25I1N1]|uniref:TetR/AcrR family transcriptional regulator n=1 Tax=Paraburkholderia sp. BL25I1N1 TaxID=1938804 RepID=UPI000D07A452|nr:TetR/AcrR family transcriptional regulator [Paraburkholderia sp. BL25I1N1]PRX89407.1 TetR family transcriptional regulator [Paraburkholderia sp. BL25I1N1]